MPGPDHPAIEGPGRATHARCIVIACPVEPPFRCERIDHLESLLRRSLLIALGLIVAGLVMPSVPTTNAAEPIDPKIVIIVGATHSSTSAYRSRADEAYAEAVKYSSNVVRVYSPNATWGAVRSALQGASVVLYLGHGNGFPSPYSSTLNPLKQNGFGLNKAAGQGDYNNTYYGESYIAKEIDLAPNALVILNHLCYASGNSEPGHAEPSVSVARQRIDNYAAGFLKAGARAVIADAHYGAGWWFRALFTTRQTVEAAWKGHPAANGNAASWSSARSSGFVSWSDPDSPTKGFYRSLVGQPGLTTTDVTGGAFAETGSDPSDFVVPGAASVDVDGAPVYDSADVAAEPTATLAAGTRLRVNDDAGAVAEGARILEVETLDGSVAGHMITTDLVPRDSLGPQLWGVPETIVITPNGDGTTDTLRIEGRFSEDVAWTAKVVDASGSTIVAAKGSGTSATLAWDGTKGGSKVPDGVYRWVVTAVDDWGNEPLDRTGAVIVDSRTDRRLAGADRYATAAAISAASFGPGVAVAYVATGANFPDALAGSAAAGSAGAPVLLVTRDTIPTATATELGRLKPARIVVLGGAGVVTDAVKAALARYTAGSVSRLAGADRYATAAAISAASFGPGVAVAYVATGANFPDALAGSAAAGSAGAPVLLVTRDTIPTATATELGRLKPARIVVLGGDRRRDRRGQGGPRAVHRRLGQPPRRGRPLRDRRGDQRGLLRPGGRRRLRGHRGELPRRPRRQRRRRQRRGPGPARHEGHHPDRHRDRARPPQARSDRRPRRDRRRDRRGQGGPRAVRGPVAASGSLPDLAPGRARRPGCRLTIPDDL